MERKDCEASEETRSPAMRIPVAVEEDSQAGAGSHVVGDNQVEAHNRAEEHSRVAVGSQVEADSQVGAHSQAEGDIQVVEDSQVEKGNQDTP